MIEPEVASREVGEKVKGRDKENSEEQTGSPKAKKRTQRKREMKPVGAEKPGLERKKKESRWQKNKYPMKEWLRKKERKS